jgi:asparagine synthase (glutamine-hydrolysing)
MCGITGFVDYSLSYGEDVLTNMSLALRHRGPDDIGQEFKKDDHFGVGLGHTRLAILDLSSQGHQPMKRESLIIVLNGEIYNYKEIRIELQEQGVEFTSTSDTEVVLQSYNRWGSACVNRFIGMFAYVIYNTVEKKLHLCRDRVGVKPLFYYSTETEFLFASELKSFHQFPTFDNQISKTALAEFLSYGYIRSPRSIYRNTYKVEPGTFMDVDLNTNKILTTRYWNPRDYFSKPILNIGYDEAKEELTSLLRSSCEYRMISDVPVGIFLSGGYDSAAVASLLQQGHAEQIKTFTIGFESSKNEAPFAEAIANYLGTSHTSYYCRERDAMEIVTDLCYFYDEPCGDISCIPTILLSRLASQSVKVVLSGDGGDEILAGYGGYLAQMRRWHAIDTVPDLLQKIFTKVLSSGEFVLPDSAFQLKHKVKGLKEIFDLENEFKVSRFVENSRKTPDSFVYRLLGESFQQKLVSDNGINSQLSFTQFIDYTTSLPDLLLTKVDRATMSASIEGREPLLDHRLLEFTARLPTRFKVQDGSGKKILKDIVHDIIPTKIMDRPKMGFDLPLFEWLKGDLSYLINEFLDQNLIARQKIFDPAAVSHTVKLFKSGKLIYNDILWRLLIFQMWHQKWNFNR